MSDTSRREFLSGAARLAGVSAAATVAGGVPGVALGAVRESAGKSAITTPTSAIVETSAGKLRGYVRNGIFTFKGIPYAGTTVGEARFLPPSPVTPWTQVRASMSYGPVCPQPVRISAGSLGRRQCSTALRSPSTVRSSRSTTSIAVPTPQAERRKRASWLRR